MSHIDAVTIDITKACNLKCDHCFANCSPDLTVDVIPDEYYEIVVEKIGKINPYSVCICGGEPLLRKELVIKLINNLKAINISSVNIVTNGLLLDTDFSEKLKCADLDTVQISIDNWHGFHSFEDNGTYNKQIMEAIENLVSKGCNVEVSCIPTMDNHMIIPEMVDRLENAGVSKFRMQPLILLGRASCFSNQKLDTFHQLKFISQMKRIKHSRIIVEWNDPSNFFYDIVSVGKISSISIDERCRVLLSPYLNVSFGNILYDSINDIETRLFDTIKNPYYFRMFSDIAENGIDYISSINVDTSGMFEYYY